VQIPWSSDPTMSLPLQLMPLGSVIHGEAEVVAVGGERLRILAAAMADATGLAPGRPPVFVEGQVGGVSLRVSDGPRGGNIGIDVDITFPDVELGIDFRPHGMLDGLRDYPLLPGALQKDYHLKATPEKHRPPIDEPAVAAFTHALLTDIGAVVEIRLSDHHLGLHYNLANDGADDIAKIARFAHAHAKRVSDAIRALPFPPPAVAGQSAWQSTAVEQSAMLIASGPSLHGLSLRTRILGGEERAIAAAIRTEWREGGPVSLVEIDHRHLPLPRAALAELEAETPPDRARALRAAFPVARAESGERVTLEREGFASDPRALLPGLDLFLAWALDARGERRTDSPYR
jgi:hypothetical protein